jgi:hypothetical protein
VQVVLKNNQCNITDVNILEGRVHTIKEYADPFLVASKEIGLDVNNKATRVSGKYVVMSRDQNAG